MAVWVLLLSAGLLAEQQRFEVASVRQNTSQASAVFSLTPTVRFVNMPLSTIISVAYVENLREALTEQHRFDFSKVDASVLNTTFDIETRGDGNQLAMLRTLLQERFGLRTHTEMREGVQYTLTASEQLAPGLKPSSVNCVEQSKVPPGERAPECSSPNDLRGGVRVRRFAGTIDELIRREVSPRLQSPVIDRTGLKGNFVWELAVRPVREEGDMIPAITDALAELGLKLERTRGLAEVIVIDQVEMPTPN
jgi:uncharacterized protein (TIGR03435 family)